MNDTGEREIQIVEYCSHTYRTIYTYVPLYSFCMNLVCFEYFSKFIKTLYLDLVIFFISQLLACPLKLCIKLCTVKVLIFQRVSNVNNFCIIL